MIVFDGPGAIERIFIVVHDSNAGGVSLVHNVGLNHKPYCGAGLNGVEWEVIDTAPSGVVFCGDCLLKEMAAVMADANEDGFPIGSVLATGRDTK